MTAAAPLRPLAIGRSIGRSIVRVFGHAIGRAIRPTARRARVEAPGRLALALLLLCGAASGCALKPPAPWERGDLARPEMALQTDVLEARLQQHIYTSKENASGGAGIGGGGCGCN